MVLRAGRCREIADEWIRLEVVASITDSTICGGLKQRNQTVDREGMGFPTAGAKFVARMEDMLEVYQSPMDSLYPVVCINETDKQPIKEACRLTKRFQRQWIPKNGSWLDMQIGIGVSTCQTLVKPFSDKESFDRSFASGRCVAMRVLLESTGNSLQKDAQISSWPDVSFSFAHRRVHSAAAEGGS